MCCGTCIQSTIHSASPSLLVSDILPQSVHSILHLIFSNSPLRYLVLSIYVKYILLNLFFGGPYGQAPQHKIQEISPCNNIIVFASTCSEMLNLKAISCSIGCNIL